MPWRIIKADYDAQDRMTLHDDELIALERTLREAMGSPQNEYNPAWRAWKKIRPLAAECTGDGDPTHVLPAGAAGESRLRED